ncbi:MAG: ankyrin [Thermodesulfobacteriota bacterium]
MTQEKNTSICPTCAGEKVITGTCTCDMEWRGTQEDDNWEDCQCTPEVQCPTCHGTGVIKSGK